MNDIAVNVNKLVDNAAEKYVSLLSQYKWDMLPDSQLQAAKKALTKNDYIMKIAASNPESVYDSLAQAATLGLDLTEGKKQGWLLPRKNQNKGTDIVLQVGYKGVEAIHQKMGVIDRLVIRTVRENDIFTWSGNDSEKPEHTASVDKETPNWFASAEVRGPIAGVFSITYFPDGSIHTMVASITDVFEKHRDRSDSYKSYLEKKKKGGYAHPPPWVSDEQSMVEKTMAFIAAKQWPANNRDEERSSQVLETLHQIDISDYSLQYTKKQKDAFFNMADAEDALGLYLFSKWAEIEVYAAIHREYLNTAPRGGKTKVRNRIDGMVGEGQEIFQNIIRAIEENDPVLLMEQTEDQLVPTEKLLKAKLNDHQKIEYLRMMESDEEGK